jgi:phage recombination protein Bet
MATEWTQERIELIKRSICPKGISNDEFALFVEQCKRSGLDPLLKEAFCVPRRVNAGSKDKPNWITKHEFQPSEAGMLTRAERMPDFIGVQASAVYAEDDILVDQGRGEVRHTFNPAKRKGTLVGAWARLERREKSPIVLWLDFAAYAQSTPQWGKMPATMIEKCARAAALRKGYPSHFGGLYVAGERPDDVDTGEEDVAAPPIERPSLPPPAPRETLEVSPVKEKVPAEIDGSAGFAMMRELGSDDVPDDAENASLSIVHACESVQDLEAYRALAQRGMALPDGSEAKRRASNALRRAHKRLTAQVQKESATP